MSDTSPTPAAAPAETAGRSIDLIVVGILLAVVAAVYAGARLYEAFHTGVFRLEIPVYDAPASVPLGADRVSVTAEVSRAMVPAPQVTIFAPIAFVTSEVLSGAGWIIIALQGIGIARRFRRGQVFGFGNARRLGIIAGVLWLMALLSLGVDRWVTHLVLDSLHAGSLDAAFQEPPAGLVLIGGAVVASALAGAFRQGEKWEKDAEGLV